nr:transposase, MuDR [Tanacetum cinerariifolium]
MQQWFVRDDNDASGAENVYETSTDLFSMKVYHGGSFTPKGRSEYVLGYSATEVRYYHYLKPGTKLDYGLVVLGSDQDVKQLLKYAVRNKRRHYHLERTIVAFNLSFANV